MLTFDLSLPLTKATVVALKGDLARALPAIKSSHRAEALARAMGFATNAALRAALADHTASRFAVDATAFSCFLIARAHPADTRALYRAAARVAIRDVMNREPFLTSWGYRIGRPQRKYGGRYENDAERQARFQEMRNEMLSDGCADEFLRALVLVQLLKPIKSINPRAGSYGLKHRAENLASFCPDGSALGPHYVSNGVLMAAAVHAGYRYKTYADELGYTSINVAFNMSQMSIDDVLATHDPSRLTSDRHQRAMRRSARLKSSSSGHPITPVG